MPSVSYGALPFREQIDFFRRKLNIPTRAWTDIYSQEHDWAFMVAGANRDALVSDFRSAVEKVIAEGATLESFRKDFDRIVAGHGWDYNGGREWRSRTIYETNLFSSYHAGRYEQLMAARANLPYWQYHHSGLAQEPRAEHQAWDGMILRADDPWWRYYFPVNAWGCQCYVTAHSEEDLRAMGRTGPDTAPEIRWVEREIGQRSPDGPRLVRVPEGIDPGFEHTPGQSRLNSAVPPERPDPPLSGSQGGAGLPNRRPADPLPQPRVAPSDRLLGTDLSETDYAQAFLSEFGATLETPALFRDVVGDSLVIGRDLFVNRRRGDLKANRYGRGPYMRFLADTVREPDEIWVRLEWQEALKKAVVRRRYIARWEVPGMDVPALAVFEWSSAGWTGITTFQVERQDIDDMRVGIRLFRRGE